MRDRDLHEHIRTMSDGELAATRRDLATGLGFMTPGNGMYAPATTFLNAVDTELAQRQRRTSRQPPAPGPGPGGIVTSPRTVGTGRDDPRQWVKAAYLLIDAIQAGAPGKLPPRAEVAAKLGINEATVTRAYRELAALGIIREVPGLGYFGGQA